MKTGPPTAHRDLTGFDATTPVACPDMAAAEARHELVFPNWDAPPPKEYIRAGVLAPVEVA